MATMTRSAAASLSPLPATLWALRQMHAVAGKALIAKVRHGKQTKVTGSIYFFIHRSKCPTWLGESTRYVGAL